MSFKCKEYNYKWNKPINGLDKIFPSVYKFCNNDLNKFALLLRKGIYPYEYMDSWEKFNSTTIPSKEVFHCKLILEDITNEGYAHAKRVWGVFEIKSLGEHDGLYIQSDTFLLADW